jgi:hypothetical protein
MKVDLNVAIGLSISDRYQCSNINGRIVTRGTFNDEKREVALLPKLQYLRYGELQA